MGFDNKKLANVQIKYKTCFFIKKKEKKCLYCTLGDVQVI